MEAPSGCCSWASACCSPSLLIPVLWVMLALTLFTAGQRFVRVWRQASAPAPPVQPLADRWRNRRVARSTQRTWRRRAVSQRRLR